MNGARFIRHDLSLVVEELLEEQEEHRKRAAGRRTDAGAAGREHRLLLRPGAGAVRRQLRDQPRRVRRAARHERRRQVDDPARASADSKFPSAASCASTAATSPTSRPSNACAWASCSSPAARACSRALPCRQNLAISARLHGGTNAEIDAARREGARVVPRARRTAQAAGAQPLGRSATDARARTGADPRARDPADRRALARPRARRRATHARARRRAEGARPDDAHRRAVAQRRVVDRRPGDLPREGRGAVRRPTPPSSWSATTSPGPCSSGPRAADAHLGRCSSPTSGRPTSSSSASSRA